MSISTKFQNVQPGDLFYESPKEYYCPRVLEFIELSNTEVEFKVVSTGETFKVDADDRYGKYPVLTKAKVKYWNGAIYNGSIQLANRLARCLDCIKYFNNPQ